MSTQDSDVTMHTILGSRTAMTVAVRLSTVLGTAAVLAACGSGGTSDNGSGDTDTSSDVVAARPQDHPELGRILVEPSGKTLYFTDQEADGTIRCVNACLEFWLPATSPDGVAPSVPGVTAIDILHRPDSGQVQLTYDGKPLYSFSLDKAAGDITGNDLEDDFGDTHFVWHAVTIDTDDTATPSPSPGTNGGDYGGLPGGY